MKKILNKISAFSKIGIALIDSIIIFLSYFILEIFIRNNFLLPNEIARQTLYNAIIAIIVYEIVFCFFKVYYNIIRYENGKDYLKYFFASAISCTILCCIIEIFNLNLLSVMHNIADALLISMFLITYRVIVRMLLIYEDRENKDNKNNSQAKKLLIIGAGSATRNIIRSIETNLKGSYNIVGLIDDDKRKIGRTISDIKVLGDRKDIVSICKDKAVDIIFFSISKIDNKDRKEILEICQNTGTRVRILPSTEDIIKNKNLIENLRDVEIEDILGRDPIKLDNNNIEELISDKVILVTGGGGSIGSELCRQIVKYNPKKLVIFDIYENNLYNIEMELKQNFPNIKVDAIVGSVRDKNKIEDLFKTYKPYLVFHAAAHKHVPLMEISPLEAIKNNVLGTYNVVKACDKYNVKRFVLISTDKAVNPTNIMGATKRMCEMIIQTIDKASKTEFVAVRFGNVLGSNGSVVPLFKKQIANGGPVTVTHKDITRFFMTIPEAAQLVLQAITYAKGGEIFVLDMGEPVKIYDLAESMIRLSGFEPNVDIPIKITGLRPGEKLYEELLMSEEGLQATKHNKIFVAEPLDLTIDELEEKIKVLSDLVKSENHTLQEIKDTMKEVVPTYEEPDKFNKRKIS